jgi:hypothetical protein
MHVGGIGSVSSGESVERANLTAEIKAPQRLGA